ncbi:hypothetical protein AB0F72_41240 [Actinoplanes sp. NPDC023936]|uniref:hypothetical protein n=1 Tax=Actinoplanes sp. NPDC023936 TaxID=3154910 RepID=UPI0033CAF331
MNEWRGGLHPGDGCSAAELDAAEQALGFTIPPLLRQFHGLLGNRDDVLRTQDPVLRPRQLHLDGPDILVIREENQRGVLWGFEYGEAPDPPMRWKDLHRGSAAIWRDYGQPLSAFLVESVLGECLAGGSLPTIYAYLDEAVWRTVPDHFAPLSLPRHVYWPIPDGPRHGWYANDQLLVSEMGNNSVWAMGRTEEACELMSAAVPGDWRWLD